MNVATVQPMAEIKDRSMSKFFVTIHSGDEVMRQKLFNPRLGFVAVLYWRYFIL